MLYLYLIKYYQIKYILLFAEKGTIALLIDISIRSIHKIASGIKHYRDKVYNMFKLHESSAEEIDDLPSGKYYQRHRAETIS